MPESTIDPTNLVSYLTDAFKEKFSLLIAAAATDIDAYLTEILPEMTIAVANGDVAAVKELNAQVRMLGEKHRITAAQSTWHLVGQLFEDSAKFASAAILTGVTGGMAKKPAKGSKPVPDKEEE